MSSLQRKNGSKVPGSKRIYPRESRSGNTGCGRELRCGTLTEGSAIYLQCEKCGAPIRSGRFCEKCKYEMSMDLQSVLPKKPVGTQNTRISRDGERMRYL